jgi:hypothetical protein
MKQRTTCQASSQALPTFSCTSIKSIRCTSITWLELLVPSFRISRLFGPNNELRITLPSRVCSLHCIPNNQRCKRCFHASVCTENQSQRERESARECERVRDVARVSVDNHQSSPNSGLGASINNLLLGVFAAVFQGIAFTCAKQTSPTVLPPGTPPSEASIGQEQRYELYRDLWRRILDPVVLPDLEMTDSNRTDMKRIIYEQFITSTLSIIQKLDLSYDTTHAAAPAATPAPTTAEAIDAKPTGDTNDDAELTSDIFRNLQPNMPKDFELFLNLVAFSRDILLSVHTKFFIPWLYLFGRTVIEQSNRYPLVRYVRVRVRVRVRVHVA